MYRDYAEMNSRSSCVIRGLTSLALRSAFSSFASLVSEALNPWKESSTGTWENLIILNIYYNTLIWQGEHAS